MPDEFNTYFRGKGINHRDIIIPILGNRFHVFLKDAAGAYFLKTHILEFFRKTWKPTNDLHRAVINDLNNENFVIACRALGIVGKHVSSPWMRLTRLESEDPRIES